MLYHALFVFCNFSGSFVAIWKFSEQDDAKWMIVEGELMMMDVLDEALHHVKLI